MKISRLALMPTLVSGLLTGCVTAPEQTVPIALDGISRGAPVMSRSVASWKERKFTNLVRQRTDFSCGAAALATIFNYAYGRSTTEQQVLVNMLKTADPDLVRERGFSLLDMKNYAQEIGMTAEGFAVDYDALLGLNVPAIALLDIDGYKHFVVIQIARDDYIHIGDPALGNRVMGRSDFNDAWNGVAFVILGENYNPQTVLRNPPPPLSAAKLFGMTSPVRNAEIYEYGLGPAFNFQP